jgi:hypothetical protein
MVCLARTNGGVRDAMPLHIRDLQFDALVYVSQAFVRVQMICNYPNVRSGPRSGPRSGG